MYCHQYHGWSAGTAVLDRVVEQALTAVREDGTDTRLLGHTWLAPIAPLAAARARVPAPGPIRTGYTVSETLLKRRREHRTVAYPQANSLIVSKLESLVAAIAGIEPGAKCEVCLLGQRSQDCAS